MAKLKKGTKMRIHKPIFFLPVESTPRELDYKINIAKHFCNMGFDIIIGNPPFIRDELQYKNYRGVFLEKGVNPDPEYYENLKRKGILLYCLSDEGASYPAFSVTYQPAVDALKMMELIFMWGEFQVKDLLERCSDAELNKKYQVTGYPSFDLSLPKYKDYHKRFKPKELPNEYVLINTNFGSFNGSSIEEVLKACTHMSPETFESLENSYKLEEKSFFKFYDWVVQLIKEFPKETFLIRPHPVEKIECYEKYFSDFKNVFISQEGNANQAIASAKIVLHNDCTTALQSYLMGVPVVSLAYPSRDYIHATWALDFGAQPESINEAKDIMAGLLKNKVFDVSVESAINEKASLVLSKLFANVGCSTETLISMIKPKVNEFFSDLISYKVIDKRSLIQKIKLFIRRQLPLHYKVSSVSHKALTQFSEKDLRERLSALEKVDGIQLPCTIKKMFPNTFFISKDDAL